MMLLLFLYGVRSERELMSTIPLRLDSLWVLGCDIDTQSLKRYLKARYRVLEERLDDLQSQKIPPTNSRQTSAIWLPSEVRADCSVKVLALQNREDFSTRQADAQGKQWIER